MLIHLMVLLILLSAAITDLRGRRIPDFFGFLLIVAGTANCIWHGYSLAAAFVHGAAILILFLVATLVGEHAMKKKGLGGCALGGGDIKLLAALAYTIGAYAVLIVSCAGFSLALLYKISRNIRAKGSVTAVPMAPFFFLGYILMLML